MIIDKLIKPTLALALLGVPAIHTNAQRQAPAMTLHVVGTGTEGMINITLGATTPSYYDIDSGYGEMEYKVESVVVDPEGEMSATTISVQPSHEGEIKIYGDPLKLNYVDVSGANIDRIDLSQCKNIEILNVGHNYIHALDVSHLKSLMALYANDNPFDQQPLVIGPEHPQLVLIEIISVEHIDQSLNISDYPALKAFNAFGCRELRHCDPTGCKDLILLSLDCTNVASLDVSQNPELMVLNVSQTKISEIDLSHNRNLKEFYCDHLGAMNNEYKFRSIDITNNDKLTAIFCSGNLLKEIDLRGNPALRDLFASNNYITSLDLSGNPDILSMSIAKNCMDFVTLPEPDPQLVYYTYNQRPLPFDRCYPVGASIDLTDRLIREGTTTSASLYMGDDIIGSDYYSYDNGVITLKKEVSDSIHFVFSNTMFPDANLLSTNFRVKSLEEFAKDNPIVTFRLKPTAGSDVEFKVGIVGASPENPKRFAVDFGDGIPVDFQAISETLPEIPNVKGTKKKIGAMQLLLPENTDISAFAIDNIQISAIDVTAATTLKRLEITDCGIPSINLNNNKWLEYLDLSGNLLKALNLDPEEFRMAKNGLRVIYANNNQLETFTHETVRNPTILELAHNRLTDVNLVTSYYIEHLNLASNDLTFVNLYDCLNMKYLNLADNHLTEQEVPKYINLDYLNVSGNNIPLAKLQLPSEYEGAEYHYAPQQQWSMPVKGPSISMIQQWLDVNGASTEFHWFRADDNTELTADQCISTLGYIFRFPDTSVGDVYGTWTHPLFPEFNGENIYRSDNMTVAGMPTEVLATFTTLEDKPSQLILTSTVPESYLYVDWRNDGNPEQYKMIDETFTVYEVPTYADTEVKVLAYEGEDHVGVFSYSGSTMSKADFSKMKNIYHLTLENTNLSPANLILPSSKNIVEFNFSGNPLNGMNFDYYENLISLTLRDCGFTSIDVKNLKKLQRLMMYQNEIEFISFDNPEMWELDLSSNRLTDIDLSGAPNIEQLWLSYNYLTTLDVTPLTRLTTLWIFHNSFKLTTLPRVRSSYHSYFYYDQYPWDVDPVENVVDLSEQLMVGQNRTTYRWFRDDLYYNEYGDIVGDEMEEGVDYTEENGVFTFIKSQHNARCLLTNVAFPDIIYVTKQMNIATNKVDTIGMPGLKVTPGRGYIDIAGNHDGVTLYTTDGLCIGRSDLEVTRFNHLTPGIYILHSAGNNVKVWVR